MIARPDPHERAFERNSISLMVCFLVCFVVVVLSACDFPTAGSQSKSGGGMGPAAKMFDDMLKQLREEKRKYDKELAEMPLYLRRGQKTDKFDVLDVKVEDWYAIEEAKFAHSIKIPNPVPEDSGYKPGMTQQEYFEHLCKTEAGEFIYKTVDNVEGIYQLRPRKLYTGGEWQHLYAIEDPYGYWPGEAEDVGSTFANTRLYSFFEIPVSGRRVYAEDLKRFHHPSLHLPPPSGAKIARYNRNIAEPIAKHPLVLEYEKAPHARYAFTWRGIKRPHDRELGIAGGELIVIDLQSKEVLGVRRGYVIWNRGWTGRVCPRYGYSGGQDKTTYFTTWFVAKVARPPRWQEFFADHEKFRVLPK